MTGNKSSITTYFETLQKSIIDYNKESIGLCTSEIRKYSEEAGINFSQIAKLREICDTNDLKEWDSFGKSLVNRLEFGEIPGDEKMGKVAYNYTNLAKIMGRTDLIRTSVSLVQNLDYDSIQNPKLKKSILVNYLNLVGDSKIEGLVKDAIDFVQRLNPEN